MSESKQTPSLGQTPRVGSPFAPGSESLVSSVMAAQPSWGGADQFAAGVRGETAAAAGAAAWMLVVFSVAGWGWFPQGSVVIAALGIAMSVWGLASRRRKSAAATLVIHIALGAACYFKALSM